MAENFTAEAFSLLAISLVVIALRWVSRLLTVGFWRLAADDYLMIIAGVRQTFSFLGSLTCFTIVSLTLLRPCTRQKLPWPTMSAKNGKDSPTPA